MFQNKLAQLLAKVSTETYHQSINLMIYFLVKVQDIQCNYQDLKTEGLTLMIVESGHINFAPGV